MLASLNKNNSNVMHLQSIWLIDRTLTSMFIWESLIHFYLSNNSFWFEVLIQIRTFFFFIDDLLGFFFFFCQIKTAAKRLLMTILYCKRRKKKQNEKEKECEHYFLPYLAVLHVNLLHSILSCLLLLEDKRQDEPIIIIEGASIYWLSSTKYKFTIKNFKKWRTTYSTWTKITFYVI